MKTLSAALIIITLLFNGCKKDTPVSNAPKTYLLKTTTYTVMPFNNTTSDQYTYDDKNRVIEFKSANNYDYKYSYDANNNLVGIQNYDQSNTLVSTNKLSYAANAVTVQTTDVDDNGGQPYIFTLNSLGQVSSVTIDGEQFTYDSNGNLTHYTACCTLTQSDTYTYDNKRHPLSMIGAKNLHLMYYVFGTPTTFVNNVVTDADLGSPYTYTYNSDGFPTGASTKPVSGSNEYLVITYDYIIK